MVFLSQKVDGNMIFTDYWKVLVLTFSEMGNTIFSWAKKLTEICLLIMESSYFQLFGDWKYGLFFESRGWWKDDIYWLLRSFCFELFGDGKYGLFFTQNVDEKMICTWSFWAFYDIPWPGNMVFRAVLLFRKMQTPEVNNSRTRKVKNVEFTEYGFYKEPSI